MPFVLWGLGKVIAGAREKELSFGSITLKISAWPFMVMSGMCVIMLLWQSICFANTFVFRDEAPRDSQVTTIPAVANMQTNAENAEMLEELGAYVAEHSLAGRRVLLFGDVPALSAYLEMPFVMSPWPDLPSYSNATFEAELQKVTADLSKERAIIILGRSFNDFLTSQLEDEEKTKTYEAKYGFKLSLIRDMIETYEYICTFENKKYVIYE